MKWNKGQTVKYKGQAWTVCEGGYSDRTRKVHVYKLARGSWKRMVPGNCISA